MRRGRRSVPGYDYLLFGRRVAELHGPGCWIHRLLMNRPGVEVPWGMVMCDGGIDAHHLAPKRLLKREFPHGVYIGCMGECYALKDDRPFEVPEAVREVIGNPEGRVRSLADLLNDGRNGVLGCRRHHDMVESAEVKIRRGELPAEFVEFATELGLDWFLSSRAFGQEAAHA